MKQKLITIIMSFFLITSTLLAQIDIDGVMMEENGLCIGPVAGYNSWKEYWEGTLKRENLNLGKVSAATYNLMGNYGITNRLNVMFTIPYVKTKASAGQMAGQGGLQDVSFWIKWKGYRKRMAGGSFSLFAIGGFSLPASNYTADMLPLSIGLKSKALSLRVMADFQKEKLFATASATFVKRSNIKLDRVAYYTTEMHYTNEVKMPDAASYNIRAGYRNNGGYAELFFDGWKTLGGFDITRNNMPFPSNEMNATKIGFNFKYPMPFKHNLAVTGNVFTTLSGRNIGKVTGFNAGIFYVIDLTKKNKPETKK